MNRLKYLSFLLTFLTLSCASAVYNYDYERGNGVQYPENLSVGYYPSISPLSVSGKMSLSAGIDMSYLAVPMGANIFLYNKNVYAGLRIGDQWSTIDNEVIGAELTIGGNYFLNDMSAMSLSASYGSLNLTPRKIVQGKTEGLKLTLHRILIKDNNATSFFPELITMYLSNNIYKYDFRGIVERYTYTDTLTVYDTLNLHYKNYLWSVGIGLYIKSSPITCTFEVGRVFPEYIYDINDANPIKYVAYLTTGFYINF